jgi:hypothetical protein
VAFADTEGLRMNRLASTALIASRAFLNASSGPDSWEADSFSKIEFNGAIAAPQRRI